MEKSQSLEHMKYMQDSNMDLEMIFDNKYLFLAFREYLHSTYSHENLSFWVEAEIYRRTTKRRKQIERSKKIIDKYLANDCLYPINIDYDIKIKILEDFETKISRNMFREAQKSCWNIMKNMTLEFFTSDIYKQYTERKVHFEKSKIKRKKENSVYHIDKLFKLKRRLREQGRDIKNEINEEDVPPLGAQKKSKKIEEIRPINKRKLLDDKVKRSLIYKRGTR